jgi:1,4-dihydroxy-2-naphthoate octaprenyltransferase
MIWALIILLLVLAVIGGLAIHPLLFLILIGVAILAAYEYRGGRRLP